MISHILLILTGDLSFLNRNRGGVEQSDVWGEGLGSEKEAGNCGQDVKYKN